ncbi:MAG TPA: cardiolipin synthase [bacterium]|jgi:cardiolipin synthase|nr:cardiolipin synthase [bacterium]
MSHYLLVPSALVAVDFFLRLYFCLSVIRRKLPVGVAWAWLCLILLLPLAGTLLYLSLGEYRLGRKRRARLESAARIIDAQLRGLCQGRHQEGELQEPGRALALSVRNFFGAPLLTGNDVVLLDGADEAFPALIADIDRAQSGCDLETYIWSDGGRADAVAEALIRAAGRGVPCRVLVDAIGSRAFLGGSVAGKLRAAGVEVRAALPSGLLRSLFRRPDLRMHRKITVIDGSVAYIGSLNLADPLYFNLSAGVGHWVDALCRIQGPAVRALHLVFLGDWSVETRLDPAPLENAAPPRDSSVGKQAAIQCVPSGPALKSSAIEEVMVAALYTAQSRLTLTTPYFLPGEPLFYALVAAARRGVDVTLILPEKVDSWFIQHASHAFFRELLESGVRVALYEGGLLHTKSLVVDGAYSIFGSLNLDPRSLRINFEISLAIFDGAFAASLGAMQARYLARSRILEPGEADKGGALESIKEDIARLAGPLL